MMNPIQILKKDVENVAMSKSNGVNYDLADLVRLTNTLNNKLLEKNENMQKIRQENKLLKQKIKELEFRNVI